MWAVLSSPLRRSSSELWRTRGVQFNACSLRLELRSRHQNDATIAAAKVEHRFAGFQSSNFEHFLNNQGRRRIIGASFLADLSCANAKGAIVHNAALSDRAVPFHSIKAPDKCECGC